MVLAKRVLQTPSTVSQILVLTVLPDPYLSTSQSVANQTITKVNSGNFTTAFKDLMPSVSLVNANSISSLDSRLDLSLELVPKFRHISFLPANITTDSISFKLSVINTDAIMYVGMLKADQNIRAPLSLSELVNNTRYQVAIAKQGEFVEFKYSDLQSSSDYNFFLQAIEPVFGKNSTISKATLKTKGNDGERLNSILVFLSTLLIAMLILF